MQTKTITRSSITVFIWMLCLLCISVQAQLTINVMSVPSSPVDPQIFIAGNFNNWNPVSASYQLTKNQNDIYSLTFSPQAGLLEFKFTRGSWETVEGNASGNFIPNRTYNYTGGMQTIDLNIAGWEDNTAQHTAAANVHIIDETFYMPQLNRSRRVWIYLPPDYESTSKHYPVVYMHDGQNLFDAFYSFAGEWKIDESMNSLFAEGDYGAIIVGIDNGPQRINEYSPFINPGYGGGDGELYASFLVNTLKPYIDSTYRTYPSRIYTAIAGSSLGANISMFTAIEYPETFSKVGIFSPAFWFSDSLYYHVSNTGVDEEMRIYFVAGDNESENMISDMHAMIDTLIAAGADGNDLRILHHADGAHSEYYWAREYPDAYEWLFEEIVNDAKEYRIVKDLIYPNPANNFLRIRSADLNVPFKIYTSLGKVVMISTTVRDSINISGLPPGFYVLEIKSGQTEISVARFIKQ